MTDNPTPFDAQLSACLDLLAQQIERKRKLYDGMDSIRQPDQAITRFLFSLAEELGEVSSALTRERYELAKAECIDVAHSAILLYMAIKRKEATR